jgi:hypothetical protein
VSVIRVFTRSLSIVFLVSGQLLASSVSLAWNANSESDLAGYCVYRTQTPGTNYVRLNASVVTAPSYVDTTAVAGATYYYAVSATNASGLESSKSSEVQAIVPVPNKPPTANAGPDQTVAPGASVTLTGSGTDPNGDVLTYSWSQISGPAVTLSGASTAKASLTAPSVAIDTTLGFRLTVNDGKGGVATDDVNILVHVSAPVNHPPIANAGPDQTVAPGVTVTLKDSSTDPDGDPLTRSWSQISGPTVSLQGAMIATATFTAPSVTTSTSLGFRLTVNDGRGGTASDDVIVTVKPSTGGLLSGSKVATPATVGLSTEGTLDWAHWGLTTAGSFDHKAGVTSTISNFAPVGSGTVTRQQQGPTSYSWTGGTPTASAINTPTGVYLPGANNGFRLTLPADTTKRTLKLYVGVWAAQGKLEASLSDGSATAFTDTTVINQTATSNAVYTLTYQAGAAGQTLTVNWTAQAVFNAYGNVTLQAATVAAFGSSVVNQAPIVNAGADQSITLPNSASLMGAASDDGLPNPPATLSLTWSKVSGPGTVAFGNPSAAGTTAAFSAAGVYVLRLTASDSLLTASDELQITVAGVPVVNHPPTANAGPDLTVVSGGNVTLKGSGTDPDSDPLTYAWSQLSGPAVSLSGASTATASFTAPVVTHDTFLKFQLKVTDSKNAQATDDVQVKVRRSKSKVVAPASLDAVDSAVKNSFVGIAVLNTSGQSDTVQIAAQTSDGSEQVLTSSVFAPQTQDAFLASSVTQNRAEFVSLKAEAKNGDLRGFFMIGRGAPDQMDGVGGELQADTQLYFPIARYDGASKALYFLTNTDATLPANVSVEVVERTGQVVKTGSLTLAPGASSMKSLLSLVGTSFIGGNRYLRVTSDVPVQGFELVAGAADFSSAAGQRATPVRTLWIPHFVLGATGEDTELRLINPGSQAAQASLRVYDDQAVLLGTQSLSIAAHGMSVVTLSGILGLNAVPSGQPFLTGHIVVDVTSPADGSANLLGTATFTGTYAQAKSTLPMWRAPSSDTLYLHVAQSPSQNVFTGLAVMNPNATAATVTVRAWDKDGRPTAEKTMLVEAGHRVVDLLNQSRLFGGTFDQVGGHLELTSDQPVVSFMVFGDGGGQFLAAVEGQSIQ